MYASGPCRPRRLGLADVAVPGQDVSLKVIDPTRALLRPLSRLRSVRATHAEASGDLFTSLPLVLVRSNKYADCASSR